MRELNTDGQTVEASASMARLAMLKMGPLTPASRRLRCPHARRRLA